MTLSLPINTLSELLARSTAPGFEKNRGACVDENPEWWFPYPSQPFNDARRICEKCPIRSACYEYGTATGQSGVWGGVDLDQGRVVRTA